jgi:hypothetical protein
MSGLGFICEEKPQRCELCGKFKECRPYGPKGEQICFQCGQKDIKTTEKMMSKYLFGD